jgi:hypothetical protein
MRDRQKMGPAQADLKGLWRARSTKKRLLCRESGLFQVKKKPEGATFWP